MVSSFGALNTPVGVESSCVSTGIISVVACEPRLAGSAMTSVMDDKSWYARQGEDIMRCFDSQHSGKTVRYVECMDRHGQMKEKNKRV